MDDVVTSGGSIQQAFDAVESEGGHVVAAITLVDRSDVAAKFFADKGILYCPLVTYHDLCIEPVVLDPVSA